jgi:hypothetical protein
VTDDALERSIRELLASRDTDPAPERLARRLAEARETASRRRPFSLLPVLRLAAASAVLAVAVALALAVRPPAGPAEPGPLAPVGTPRPGIGLATPAPPVVPVALVGTLLVLGLVMLRRVPAGMHRGLVAAGTLSLAYAYLTSGSSIELRPIAFGVDGSTPALPAGEGSEGQFPVELRPGEPFRFVVVVHNSSPETVTILGLAAASNAQASVPRLVGLGIGPDPAAVTYEGAIPFTEITLPPEGYASLVVLGDAGPCATSAPAQTTFGLNDVPLVTRVAGWERITTIELGAEITVALDSDCISSQP